MVPLDKDEIAAYVATANRWTKQVPMRFRATGEFNL